MVIQNATPVTKRFFLWALVTVYFASLPEAILVYRQVAALFPHDFVKSLPIIMSTALLFLYLVQTFAVERPIRSYLLLIPCILLFMIIRQYEPYNNKLIHVPEYVVLAWLLYAAMAADYSGRDILVLIFACASLLGIADEIIQGIHPARFYGGKDMLTNTLSALIGVLSILGLKSLDRRRNIRANIFRNKATFISILFGLIGATLTVFYLFRVKNGNPSSVSYPAWLTAWNSLFIICAATTVFSELSRHKSSPGKTGKFRRGEDPASSISRRLWTFCLLVPLSLIQVLGVVVAVSGCQFK